MTSGSPTGALGLTRLLLRVVLVVVSLASSSSSLLGGIAGVCRGQNRAMKIANDRTLVQKSPPRHDNKHSMTELTPGGAHGITDNVHWPGTTDSNDPKLLLLGRLGWWGGGARHVGDTHFQEAAKV